ncbi:helix-turn-helix domain-containing protein [Emticicia sp. CRIBPO]|uniref:helix-turn-helix domain-containing protein n=1 Tax=Emticicia sp. CRIBPO TaxID=2683258 RepID=UPI0014121044|nr:helix-turn-helix domain-containing protein [Emticicia sp. CRIBPO]NBA86543.1 helix-turn-helix domain-containing protein [Emticicia sp. CRIBPO]
MKINYNLISFIDFLAFVQGATLGIILIAKNKKSRPTVYLGLFLLTYSAELILSVFSHISVNEYYPSLYFLPFRFYALNAVVFYFYVKSLIGPFHLSKEWKTLIPATLEFLGWSTLFILSFFYPSLQDWSVYDEKYYWMYHLTAIFFSVFYASLSLSLIFRHQKRIMGNFSNLHQSRLRWVKWVALFIIFYHLLCMIPALAAEKFSNHYLHGIFSSVNVIFIYWVGISGLGQANISFDDNVEEAGNDPKNSQEDTRFSDLAEIIIKKELYKDPQLTLNSLAAQTGFTRNEISNLINKNAHTNFNVFINTYRVEEAKRLLKDTAYDHLNMLGIATEAGFNSKATFFAVFKQHMGKSPGSFKSDEPSEKQSENVK